jgi:DNA-binding CsgD family transcriptional regulator
MRQWLVNAPGTPGTHGAAAGVGAALADMVSQLGEPGFVPCVLPALAPVLPAASWSVYRTGRRCKPTLFMSASLGVPDTTQDCWWAYLSGPYRDDRTWGHPFDDGPAAPVTRLCHVTAQEVQGEHRARVYEAHGVAERVSVAEHEDDGSVFAVNFYRHQHQQPFGDHHIGDFEAVAPVLLALARKHISLSQRHRAQVDPGPPALASARPPTGMAGATLPMLRARLLQQHPDLTHRELDVCARLLQGMTHEGIASDLGLSVPTVKTYRNRAFARLGIHFRNELFARVLGG